MEPFSFHSVRFWSLYFIAKWFRLNHFWPVFTSALCHGSETTCWIGYWIESNDNDLLWYSFHFIASHLCLLIRNYLHVLFECEWMSMRTVLMNSFIKTEIIEFSARLIEIQWDKGQRDLFNDKIRFKTLSHNWF